MKVKKFLLEAGLLVLFIIIISTTFLKAQEILIGKNELPKTAQNFIGKYFSSQPISYIKKDNEVLSVDYEVKFANQMEVKFDSRGNWEEVDGEHSIIPTGFIPQRILNYINTQFPGTQILKIERKTFNKYETKISNGLELIFNSKGNFIKVDD